MGFSKCKVAAFGLLLALIAGLCPALAIADVGIGGHSDSRGAALELRAQDVDIPAVTLGGNAVSVYDGVQFTFSPTQTRAYEIAFSGIADPLETYMRVYFYKYNATSANPDDDEDYREWKRLDYDDLGDVDKLYYAFYGEAGATYKFEIDTHSGDFASASAQIVESNKAGVTGGLKWRAERMRDYALNSENCFDGVTVIGFDGSAVGDDLDFGQQGGEGTDGS